MKKIFLHILYISVALFVSASCTDMLTIEQQGVIPEDDFYNTDEEAFEAITDLYSTWRGQYFNWFYLKNLLSDDQHTGGGSRGDNSNFEMMNEYQFSSANTTISGSFSSFYTVIYKANLIIDRVAQDTPVKTRIVAEARTARAWSMTELISLWGPVPFADHVLSANEYQQPNGDIPTMWKFVENDFNEAIKVLPSKEGVNGQVAFGARLTKEAALSFLGKAQMFQGKYAEAATTLKQVINSGLYALVDDYSTIMRASNDFGPENIFESNALDDPDNAWNQGNMLFSLMINWRDDHMTGFPGTYGFHSTGWGFYNPTKSLYDAFVAEEGVNGHRLTNTIKTYDDIVANGITVKTPLVGNEGFFQYKFRFPADEVVTNSYGYLSTGNSRWMRYAEVLLLASEACLQSGDNASALNYINQIRTRAKVAPLGSVTLNDIKNEKRLELCYEGCRYQDLVRWGDAASVLKERGKQIPELQVDGSVKYPFKNDTYGFQVGKHELLPIPEHEMNVNKNIHQNPGW